jgi:hypothetical protein
MLSALGENLFTGAAIKDEFATAIATKGRGEIVLLVSNYIDPEAAKSYLSRNIAGLNSAEKKVLINNMKSGQLAKIVSGQTDLAALRLTKRLKALLQKARELYAQASLRKDNPRQLKISLKSLKGNYLYRRYIVDSSCSRNCDFTPAQEKETGVIDTYQETLPLMPYSVQMIVLKEKSDA